MFSKDIADVKQSHGSRKKIVWTLVVAFVISGIAVCSVLCYAGRNTGRISAKELTEGRSEGMMMEDHGISDSHVYDGNGKNVNDKHGVSDVQKNNRKHVSKAKSSSAGIVVCVVVFSLIGGIVLFLACSTGGGESEKSRDVVVVSGRSSHEADESEKSRDVTVVSGHSSHEADITIREDKDWAKFETQKAKCLDLVKDWIKDVERNVYDNPECSTDYRNACSVMSHILNMELNLIYEISHPYTDMNDFKNAKRDVCSLVELREVHLKEWKDQLSELTASKFYTDFEKLRKEFTKAIEMFEDYLKKKNT